jgi:hypothetical protein
VGRLYFLLEVSGMSVPLFFVLKKENLFVGWDGKTMTDRPSQAGRFSKTICKRKYPGHEMLTFPQAYDQWYENRKRKNGRESDK